MSARKFPQKWSSDFIQAFLRAEELWWVGKEDHYENTDSFREAREDDPLEVREYELQRQSGCCGEEEVTLDVTWDGNIVKVLYGFNHGH